VSDLLGHDVIPVLSGYVLLMAMLLAAGPGLRRSRPRMAPYRYGAVRGRTPLGALEPEHGSRRAGWPRLLTHLLITAMGGYVLFLAIVLIYYFGLGGKSARFLRDAFLGGAWLTFCIAVPALMAAAWLEDRLRTRRPRPTP
jgi:hypothetical protein